MSAITTTLSVVALFGLLSSTALASEEDLAHGGRLYDKWWAEAGVPAPKDTHPAYPSAGKQSGSGTWRCKECHGWDYKGRDGAYATGSHYTGIVGIRRLDGADAEKVEGILADANHRYDSVLSEDAIEELAHFVTQGQLDMAPLINDANKQVTADALRGRVLYKVECVACHGVDGKQLNFKTPEKPEYLGTIGQKNPWELLHKIRNGQPGKSAAMAHGQMSNMQQGATMPDFRRLSVADQAAIAAYIQSLPAE